ncbi:ATP-binding protein [Lacibacterium aquatile]|uniref:ATP-binding protein n=1 Tax=Lacibacterium aquatile TaxID=1168082 RepID=A0ABW5DS29_9PROT
MPSLLTLATGPTALAEHPHQAEASLAPADRQAAQAAAAKPGALITLALTTVTAYQIDIVADVSRELTRQLSLDEEHLWKIETALSEAVGNALIHGNLALGSAAREIGDFAAHDDAVAEALEDPAKASRLLLLSVSRTSDGIDIIVQDSGEGFDPGPTPENPIEEAAGGSGRGVALIQALSDKVTFADHGRSICMSFQLQV